MTTLILVSASAYLLLAVGLTWAARSEFRFDPWWFRIVGGALMPLLVVWASIMYWRGRLQGRDIHSAL